MNLLPTLQTEDKQALKQRLRDRLAVLKSQVVAEKFLHASPNSNPSSNQCSKRKLDKLVTDGMKDTAFMELFAGEAGLTLAVKREVGNVFTPRHIEQN